MFLSVDLLRQSQLRPQSVHRRWFEDGWFFEVNGEVVARGGAIGLLEQDVRQWLDRQT